MASGATPRARMARDGAIAIALGQTSAIGGEKQRMMHELGHGRIEQFVEQCLAWRRGEQVAPPHDLRHALGDIIDDADELVGEHAIAATQHEIPALAREILRIRPLDRVDERYRLVGNV